MRGLRILGIEFCDADPDEIIDQMCRDGGYLVVPAATALARLRSGDLVYRDAMTHADLAIADSGAMVLLWRFLRGRKIRRISGLKYLQRLSERLFADKSKIVWVLPSEQAIRSSTAWLQRNNQSVSNEELYVAPIYDHRAEDPRLLAIIERLKPQHVIVAVGNGPQEKLAYYLREHLSTWPGRARPAIHCIGAALAFLTGDQVAIPEWGDRLYLGWLIRLLAQPRIFIPRLSRALALPWLILRYGSELPPRSR